MNPSSHARALAALGCVAVLAAGCGSSSGGSGIKTGPAPVSSSSAGWKVYSPPGGGYRIQIQAGWSTIDASSLAGSSALQRLKAANPALARNFTAFAQMARQPGTLLAFDLTPEGRAIIRRDGFGPNIIVVRSALDPSQSDAELLAAVLERGRAQAASVPTAVGAPTTSRLSIAGRRFGAVTYRYREVTSAGSTLVAETDYVTIRNAVAYTITCTSVPSGMTHMRAVCGQSLASLAFTA